jgi:hypothetical protein
MNRLATVVRPEGTMTKFVLTGLCRAGQNILSKALALQGGVNCIRGAVYRARVTGGDLLQTFKQAFENPKAKSKAVGFALLYWPETTENGGEAWEYLIEDLSIKVIYLDRENELDRYLSKSAVELGLRPEVLAKYPLVVDPKDVVRQVRQWRAQRRELELAFCKHTMLRLTTEELRADPHEVVTQILNFLGIDGPGFWPFSDEFKVPKFFHASRLVANYPELRKACERVGLGQCF